MKKSDGAIERVRAELKRREGLATELAALPAQLEAAQRRAVELAASGDLGDPATVDGLVRAQAVAAALPARQASREAELAQGDSTLLAACHDLVTSVLGPKARNCEALAKGKARSLLRGFFRDGVQLDMAVAQSELVLSVAAEGANINMEHQPVGGMVDYAGRLLAAFQRLEELESDLAKS